MKPFIIVLLVLGMLLAACTPTDSTRVQSDTEQKYIIVFGDTGFIIKAWFTLNAPGYVIESAPNFAKALSAAANDDFVEVQCDDNEGNRLVVQASHAADLYYKYQYQCVRGVIFRDFYVTNTPESGFFD